MPNVDTGLIDFLLSPPIGVLEAHLDGNGPFGPGNHIITSWLDGATSRNVNETYGVVINFNGAIPPYLGLIPGVDDGGIVVMDDFADRMVQLVALHQLLSGGWVATQIQDLHILPYMVRWSEALPGKVGLYVFPGVSVDLSYLVVG